MPVDALVLPQGSYLEPRTEELASSSPLLALGLELPEPIEAKSWHAIWHWKSRWRNGIASLAHWLPWGYCTVPVGNAAVPVLWVLQMGTAGYYRYCGYCGCIWLLHSICGYCRVLWVLQGTVGTVGTVDASGYCTVPVGTVGTVGTVTVGYCGYCDS
jgi:hypothetical protein